MDGWGSARSNLNWSPPLLSVEEWYLLGVQVSSQPRVGDALGSDFPYQKTKSHQHAVVDHELLSLLYRISNFIKQRANESFMLLVLWAMIGPHTPLIVVGILESEFKFQFQRSIINSYLKTASEVCQIWFRTGGFLFFSFTERFAEPDARVCWSELLLRFAITTGSVL